MCKLDQKFNTWLTIYPCNALDKQSIKTGYETFDKKFNLTCGDEKLVLEILDSNRLEQIIALSNHKFSINLNEDGRLYIGAHSFKNMNDLNDSGNLKITNLDRLIFTKNGEFTI